MPRTLIINDPRPRIRDIFIDMSDPLHYMVVIKFETVEEDAETGAVVKRETVLRLNQSVLFNLDGSIESAHPRVLALMEPIREACFALKQEHDDALANNQPAP